MTSQYQKCTVEPVRLTLDRCGTSLWFSIKATDVKVQQMVVSQNQITPKSYLRHIVTSGAGTLDLLFLTKQARDEREETI